MRWHISRADKFVYAAYRCELARPFANIPYGATRNVRQVTDLAVRFVAKNFVLVSVTSQQLNFQTVYLGREIESNR